MPMFDLLEELRALIDTLSEREIEYAVCGGLAMGIHGLPRATEDIDLFVRPESVSSVMEVARERGFDLEASPMRFKGGAIEIRRITKVAPDDVLMLDLLLVTSATEDVWASRVQVRWLYGLIWAVSPDGLVKMKTLSGRPKDLWDIERLKEIENESG
jgi:aminoglycoside-2''-adenylyltransferase